MIAGWLLGLAGVLLPGVALPGVAATDIDAAMAGSVPIHAEAFADAGGFTAGKGAGVILIWRPISDVWATLAHYEDRAEYIPRLKKLKVLEQQPGRVRVWQEVDATVTTARFTAWYELDEKAHVIRWKLDPSATDNTLRDVDGAYTMVAVDDRRTLLSYRSTIGTALHVPRAIQAYMTRKSLPELLGNIKKRVESGGTWKR